MIPTVSDHFIPDLRRAIAGEVYADRITRGLYATDASPYQIDPIAVVVPRTEDDVRATLRIARDYGVPILPRGGATSLAGQTVGRAIQVDFSKYLNRIVELNADEGWVRVQPGIVLDHLNGELAPHGLKFAPDVSPGNRATIGGMIGNNSSGAYSLRYGKTIDHVLELRVLLSDGTETTLGPLTHDEWIAKADQPDREGACYRIVRDLARQHGGEIARRYPRVLRRVGGYNLNEFRDWGLETGGWESGSDGGEARLVPRSNPRSLNLSRLIVGSEGTLAVILEAKLRLVPRPKATGVALLEFADLFDALDAVVPCLETQPVAVELMDDLLIDLTRRSIRFKHYLDILQTPAAALLMVEFHGEDQADVAARINWLLQRPGVGSRITAATPAITPEQQAPVWLVRKAGLPLLQSMSPGLKPETVVEDSAVPPEHLSAYTRRFKKLIEDHGTIAAFYGHASVGLLHIRPLLNFQDPADVLKMRSLAEGVRDLVREYGGALSGEHGDGLIRSEFNRDVFGPVLYEAFRTIKRAFDPDGLLNPGKIVDAPPMDRDLRYVPRRGAPIALTTHFGFRDTGGMLGAAELCNGNGACRKTASGTMCPSYMATRDEEHSTRGRANALRLALGGALPAAELWSDRMREVLDLCLECKGCTAECPSGVNMTRLKSEWLQHFYDRRGTPLRARVFGHIHTLNRIGAALAPLSNRALRLPGVGVLGEALLGISRERTLPEFARMSFVAWMRRRQASGIREQIPGVRCQGTEIENSTSPITHQTPSLQPLTSNPSVVLFPDTFTTYNEPRIGIAAVRLLETLGYHVIAPTRPLCCGRPLISKGLLRDAKRLAQEQLEWLAPYAAHGLPIVGLEPSCALTFRDEYRDLLADPRAETLARHTLLLDEFLARELERGAITGDQLGNAGGRIGIVHGHCHQKAIASTAPTLTLLRAAGFDAREIDSGCCGMAGSFGYEREHYDISVAIGERVLLPAVRAASENAIVIASGTSCRQQIADGAERRAQHLAEVLWDVAEKTQNH